MKLIEIRKDRKLKQKDVAAKIGINGNALSNYEKGRRKPPIVVLKALANVYGVTVDELIK